MSLVLYFHPLSSFCWKTLIALYEADIPFTAKMVNLGDPAERAAFAAIWPLAKFPVLRDEARGQTVPESTLIVDYLARRYPAAAPLLPADPDRAARIRLLDRLVDNYITAVAAGGQRTIAAGGPARSIRRRAGARQYRRGYELIATMIAGPWATGETFTLADCAALPALYYADYAVSLDSRPPLRAYLDRD